MRVRVRETQKEREGGEERGMNRSSIERMNKRTNEKRTIWTDCLFYENTKDGRTMVDRTENGERRWMDWEVNEKWKMEIAQCDGDGDGEDMREMDMDMAEKQHGQRDERTDEQTNGRTDTETRKRK